MFPNYSGGHKAYQDFVVRQLRDHYADPTQLPSGLLDIAERFWQKDLTGVNNLMRDVYSPFGPRPRPAYCKAQMVTFALLFAQTVRTIGHHNGRDAEPLDGLDMPKVRTGA